MLSRVFVLSLLFIFSFLIESPANSILGFDEVMADTSIHLPEKKLEKILALHPLMSTTKNAEVITPKPRVDKNRTVLFFVSVALLFMFSLARLVFPRYFSNLFQVFSTFSFSKRNVKEQLETDNRASLWFYIIFYFSVGFVLYQFLMLKTTIQLSGNSLVDCLICTTIIFLILSIRFGLIRLIGWVFNGTELAKQYLFSKKLIHELLGLILFPICLLMLMSNANFKWILMMMAVALYILMFVYGYIRNMSLLRNLLHISFIHFLLYLCALEAIPVLILIKMIR